MGAPTHTTRSLSSSLGAIFKARGAITKYGVHLVVANELHSRYKEVRLVAAAVPGEEIEETAETEETEEETEEWAFQADAFRVSLWSIRFGAALSTIMFGLFGLARSAPALFVVCGVEVRLPLMV